MKRSIHLEYKFNEDKNIKELTDHINSTYDSHYSKEKFQATEFIVDGGDGTGFCFGNILKYAIIQLHVHDLKSPEIEDKNSYIKSLLSTD